MAIQIKVEKAMEGYDLGASKFFGTPTIPALWQEDFDEDEIFLCQIRLSDIAHLDKEGRLPHQGYLYVFLHTENGNYGLRADVRYFEGQPNVALEDFNAVVEGFEQYVEAYLMTFEETPDDTDGTRLFGEPLDWPYDETPPKLLMQFDPLDSDMFFLDAIDGYVYLFFGDDSKAFEDVTLKMMYS